MDTTIILTKTHDIITVSTAIDLSDFPLMETTPIIQEKINIPKNAATVA